MLASLDSILSCTFCTFGLFSMSRFAMLCIVYDGNFMLQFVCVSGVFGAPLLWLYASIGARVRSGACGMWRRVSPVCAGIGFAAVAVSTVMAIYSSMAVGAVLIGLKDAVFSSRNNVTRSVVVSNKTSRSVGGNGTSFSSTLQHRQTWVKPDHEIISFQV